jgi:rhomboid protease GluP
MNLRPHHFLFLAVLFFLSGCVGLPATPVVTSDILPKTLEEIEFDSKMQVFITNESMALEIFNKPESTDKETMLYEIKDRGIYYWLENLKIVEEIEKIKLPSNMAPRVRLLREYCDLRIKNYNFYYNIFEKGEKPSQHKEELEKINVEMDKLMKKLKQ